MIEWNSLTIKSNAEISNPQFYSTNLPSLFQIEEETNNNEHSMCPLM